GAGPVLRSPRRSNDQCHLPSSRIGLMVGEVNHRASLIAETRVFDVLDHADDFYRAWAAAILRTVRAPAGVKRKTETPPEGAFVPKETPRHTFIDNRHLHSRWTMVTRQPYPCFLWAEVAAGQERDAERGEGVWIDLHPWNDHIFAVLRRIALDRHRITGLRRLSHHQPFTPAHRTIANQARQLHAGNGLPPPEQFIEARGELLRLA